MKRWQIILLVAAVFVVGYYLTIPLFGPHFAEVCSKGEYGPPDQCSRWDIVTAYFLRLLVVLDEHNGIVAALASMIVAIFTCVLWVATDKMWRATSEQLALGRDEFNATHRPEISVFAVEFKSTPTGGGEGSETIGASILCVNVGTNLAKRVEARGQILSTWNLQDDVERPLVDNFEDIASGVKLRFKVGSDRAMNTLKGDIPTVHCIGTIAYWDNSGVRRETGFCFELRNPDRPYWVEGQEHNYEY